MKNQVRRTLNLLVFLLAADRCPEAGAEALDAPASYSARKPGTLTFRQDVAPILFQHCAICHHPGQSAPFNLLTYADVKKRARQVAEVVEQRYMPPWLPARGLVEFSHDRSLSVDQIGVLLQWVAEGAAEGAGTALPPLPEWTQGWRLGPPDLVVKPPQPYVLAAEGKDVYRNLVIPIPVSGRKFVQGVEFLPGNWKVVHHAFINVDSTPVSRRRAGKENPPGFDGMELPDTSRMPDGHFLGWQPGKVPQFAPEGLAWVLAPGTDLVLQLHLHPSGKPELVQPSIAFYFTSHPPTNAAFRLNLNALKIAIPAGVKDYSVEDKYTLPVDVSVIGVSPHAHYLGKRLEGFAWLPEGKRKDLILIKDWDFNWQGDYRYETPVLLPKGTILVMRWTYDNSRENVRNPNQPPKLVKHGSQTTDEMGELWYQVLPCNPMDRSRLEQDFYGHLGRLVIDYNEFRLEENPNDAEAHTRAGRARAYFGQVAQALEHFHAAIKADPKYDQAYYELGSIFLRQNRPAEARQAFETVIRLNPDDYEAEGSLGFICFRAGDLDQAELHLRAALHLNPNDQIARKNLDRVLQARSVSKNRK